MKYTLLYNKKSGSVKSGAIKIGEIYDLLASKIDSNDELLCFDITDDKFNNEKEDIFNNNSGVIIVIGGDGTISSIAGNIINSKLVLAVIPGGTFNNFSKDLGIRADINSAVDTIFKGDVLEIDTAELNGKTFLNNSSLGLYPISVMERGKNQKSYGLGKIGSMILALLKVFYLFPLYKVQVKADGIESSSKTSFIFVGNNEYFIELFNPTRRISLTDGKLSLYYTRCVNRICLINFAFKNFFNQNISEKNFIVAQVNEVYVSLKKKNVHVSLDGEVIKMISPLKYVINPRSLKVFVPKGK